MKKNNEKDEIFLNDLKRVQKITGITSASAIVVTVALIVLIPLKEGAVANILLVGLFSGIITAVFYLNPTLNQNKKLLLIPDFTYIISIIFVMKNLGEWAYLYFIFFILIIAVDAFIYDKKNYIAVILASLAAVFVAGLPINMDLKLFIYKVAFQSYGIIIIAILLRLFAVEALNIKEKKKELEVLNRYLEAGRKEIEKLFDNISEHAIISVDTQGKIALINRKALDIFNLAEGRVKHKNIESVMPNLVGKDGIVLFTDLIRKVEKPYSRNDLRFTKENETIIFHTTINPFFDESENYQGMVIFMHDVTEEEEFEERRAEFVAVASHELRTPLAVIEGYLHFLLTNNSLKYDGETKKYLNIIHDSALELIKLSKDILLTTKSEAGTLELVIEKTDLISLFKETVKEYSSKINKKGLKITIDAKEKTLQLKTDRGKAKEILINLLDNAIKFTKKGSITVSILKTEGEAIFSIKDTGIGIPLESQKLIFQKFYRAEDWQTRATGGSGLGLYISKTLAERLGGQINFKSKQGEGSLFVLSLPLKFSNKKRKAGNKNSSDTLKN